MPRITVNGVELNYIDTGTGAQTIVFSHGFLMSNALFAQQVAHFQDRYRCIAYDHRGQAKSSVPADGYDMDTQAEDAAALIKALGVGPCHFVGLSMGGFVGMRLAVKYPELLKSLVLLDTSADPEPTASRKKYKLLGFVARWFGFKLVVDKSMSILFGKTFMSDPTRADDRAQWRDHIVNGHDVGGVLNALGGVVGRPSFYEKLGQITVRTQVMVGDEDIATIPAKGERIAQAIPGAGFELIAGAGHSAPVEQPAAVNAALEKFWA
ncbi:MAG: alpha/beta fold hydrolase [Aliishimia sp.]